LKATAPQITAGTVSATVSTFDLTASNGVMHVIGSVLLPTSCSRTVVGIATGSADHTALVQLLTAADLVATLSIDTVGTGYTVFAPTNAAFARIETAILICLGLPANKVHLVNLLKYHVVGSTVVSGSLTDGMEITSLDRTYDKYKFASEGNTLIPLDVTASKITTTDLLASNGVVHIIDTVLIPKGLIAKLVRPSVVTVVAGSTAHKMLEALVIRADLATALAATNTQFTVFAPTDAAFTALPAGDLKSKLTADPISANHKALLQDVLKFHVISGATATLQADVVALTAATEVQTMSAGNKLILKATAPQITAGTVSATVSTFDLTASNGVMHVIGSVLLPPSCSRTVVDIATGSLDHTTLVQLLAAADLVATLSIDTVGTGYTVFAPTNTAFAKIETAILICLRLPANKVHLVNLLKYHVVGSTVVAGSLTDGMEITSLDRTYDKCKFASEGTLTQLDGTASKITTTDLLATNGVVHIIDTVIIPKGLIAKLVRPSVVTVVAGNTAHETLESLNQATPKPSGTGGAGGGSSILPAIIGAVSGFFVLLGVTFCVHRYRRNAPKKQEQPNATTAVVLDLTSVTVELGTSRPNEPQAEENLQTDRFELLVARAKSMTSADLELPAAAHKLKTAIFDSTFLAQATSATLNGILTTGQHCPVIGAIFSILKDLKDECSKYVKSSQECKRLSVWCVSLIGTIGRLAVNVTIDAETARLLNAAVPALLAMQELVDKRLKNMGSGLAGKAMAIFTSDDYMRLSNQAQKRVHLAIDCLALRVQVDTRIAVEEVQ